MIATDKILWSDQITIAVFIDFYYFLVCFITDMWKSIEQNLNSTTRFSDTSQRRAVKMKKRYRRIKRASQNLTEEKKTGHIIMTLF